jgi:hypothetical protein
MICTMLLGMAMLTIACVGREAGRGRLGEVGRVVEPVLSRCDGGRSCVPAADEERDAPPLRVIELSSRTNTEVAFRQTGAHTDTRIRRHSIYHSPSGASP